MKLDIHPQPKPLTFGEGDQAFSILLKPITGEQRMTILDAARSGSMQAVNNAIECVVLGWKDVLAPDGTALPLKYREGEITKSNLNEFMGAIGIKMQIRIIAGILVYVGIPTEDVEDLLKIFGDDESAVSPTPPPESATPTTASGG